MNITQTRKAMTNTAISQNGITAEWVKVDKEMCEGLMSVIPDFQRNKKQRAEARIMHDLTNGDYCQNGSSIVISDQGYLIDGQHRISSFLKTGVFPEVLVVKGVITMEGYATIDSGAPRTSADMFKSKGVKNASQMATISLGLLGLNNKTYLYNAGYSNNEIYQCYLSNEDLIKHWAHKHKHLDSIITKSTRAIVACYAEAIIDRTVIHNFFEMIESGIGAKTCLSFRRALIANSNKARGKMVSRELASVCLYSLDKFDQGVELAKVHMPSKFPYLNMD